MSYFNYTDESIKDGGAGFTPAPYGFKITRSEDSPTKSGKPCLSIDIDLYDLATKEKVGNGIKYVNFYHGNPTGASMLAALCKVTKTESMEKPNDLVSKGGVVLVGFEQDFKDMSKWYPKPAFGGFGCWYSKEKLSASEVKDGKTEASAFLDRLSVLAETPYRGQDGQQYASKQTVVAEPSTASAPESGDLPF